MDHLTSIAVFVRVAEAGTFAAVADDLNLSPTMVANHVRALERRQGARLIDRTTRRHVLTELGVVYLERCRDVLASLSAADRVGETLHTEPEGRLRVSASVSFGAHALMPVIAAYMAAYPKVFVDLNLTDRLVDLAEEGIDVGFRSGVITDDALVTRSFRQARMFAVASPAYLAQNGVPAGPRDLRPDHCLGFTVWGPDHEWRFTRGSETLRVPVRGRFNCDNGQALLTAALCGLGVVVQADVLLSDAIRSGQLIRLVPGWDLPTRPVHVVRRASARPSAKVRSFIDFAVERLGEN